LRPKVWSKKRELDLPPPGRLKFAHLIGLELTMNKMLLIAAVVAIGLFAVVVSPLVGEGEKLGINANDPELVRLGGQVYQLQCAESCHGFKLEGQPNWRTPLPEGGLPAPPHDETGHTWHHNDELLFNYTKKGGAAMAPKGFKSNMPGFEKFLTDKEIWAALSYIKSTWPEKIQRQQESRNVQ
jgi:mono/diheme cytochrome c family protein